MTSSSEALELRDIHLPEDISWWPPAPGWWIVATIILLSVIASLYIYRYVKRHRLHKASLRELEHISDNYNQHQDEQKFVRDLSIWIRRVCLSFYPRADVASLTGKDWLEFLDKSSPKLSEKDAFSQGQGKILATAPYQRSASTSEPMDASALLKLCKDWISSLSYKDRATSS